MTCNEFNSYYVNLGQVLASSIPTKHNIWFNNYLKQNASGNIFINPTSETEILQILCDIKSKMYGYRQAEYCYN